MKIVLVLESTWSVDTIS